MYFDHDHQVGADVKLMSMQKAVNSEAPIWYAQVSHIRSSPPPAVCLVGQWSAVQEVMGSSLHGQTYAKGLS